MGGGGKSWHLNLDFYLEGAKCQKCQKCHFGTFRKIFRFWGAIKICCKKCQKCHLGTFSKIFRFWGAIWHFFKKSQIIGCQVPKVPIWHFLINLSSLSRCQKCQKCLRAAPKLAQNYHRCQKCLGGTFSKIMPFRECQVPKVPASPPPMCQDNGISSG